MDEFDLEVTDLRPPVEAGARDPDDTGADEPPPSPRPLAAPHRTRRARHLRTVLTGAAVLLTVAVLLLSIPQAPATLAALLRLPTPTPPRPLPVGADTLVLQHAVPWGVLRVDGAPVPHLGTALVPPNTQGVQLPALTLARGRHSLSYEAPPFPTLRCTISVPAAPSDSCPLGPQETAGPLETFGLARIVDLGATPTLLPQRAHDALVGAAAAALAAQSPTATLTAGEPYLAPDGSLVVARGPLAATLRYTLDTGVYMAGPNGEGVCRPLCTDAHDQAEAPSAWLLTGQMDLAWQYTPAAGPPFTGAIAPGVPNPSVAVAVLVTWNGAWEVTLAPFSGEPVCDVAEAAVEAALERDGLYGQISGTVAAHPADGCLTTVQPLDDARQPVGQELALYYRFGVLYAGNATTRHRLPDLPAASPAALRLLPPLDR